jgi:phytoene synthase
MAAGDSPLSENARTLKTHDVDRFQAALFAPAERREALFALYAFDHELDRIRHAVTQPMTGLIRLQWWRDALDGIAAGRPPLAHPVVSGLARHVWPRLGPGWDRLHAAIDAREAEVEEAAPIRDLVGLDDWLGATGGGMATAALEVLGAHHEGAHSRAHALGVALATLRLLKSLPADAAAGRLLLPADRVEAKAVDLHTVVRGEPSPALAEVVGEVRALAERALAVTRAGPRVDRAVAPLLLPATLAARRLDRLRRAGDNPFDPALGRPMPLAPLRLLWCRLRGRV